MGYAGIIQVWGAFFGHWETWGFHHSLWHTASYPFTVSSVCCHGRKALISGQKEGVAKILRHLTSQERVWSIKLREAVCAIIFYFFKKVLFWRKEAKWKCNFDVTDVMLGHINQSMHCCMYTGILIFINHVNSLVGILSFYEWRAKIWIFCACKRSHWEISFTRWHIYVTG